MELSERCYDKYYFQDGCSKKRDLPVHTAPWLPPMRKALGSSVEFLSTSSERVFASGISFDTIAAFSSVYRRLFT